MRPHFLRSTACMAVLALVALGGGAHANSAKSFLNTLANQPSVSVSTTPAAGPGAGDQNPYGVAVILDGFPSDGALKTGDIIVSNFNNANNLQGTGTTIMAVTPSGHISTFFAAPPSLAPVGLTTALTALRSGLVIVGNTPTTNGTIEKILVGSLTQIASGFLHRSDPSALVVGPTGLLLSDASTLYVADTGNNRIQVLHGVRDTDEDLGSGQTVVSGAPLQGPLALARSPIGTIVASNGDAVGAGVQPNLVVEFDPSSRRFVATRQLDTGLAGGIFGIAIARVSGEPSLIYADDNSVTLNVQPAA